MTKKRVIPVVIFILTIVSGLILVFLTNKVTQEPVGIQKTQAVCDSDPGCPTNDTGYYDTCPDGTVRWCTNYKRYAADIAGCGTSCFLKCDDTICDKVCSNPTPTSIPPTSIPIPTKPQTPTSTPTPIMLISGPATGTIMRTPTPEAPTATPTIAPTATPTNTPTPTPTTTILPSTTPTSTPTSTPAPTPTTEPSIAVLPSDTPTPSPAPTNVYLTETTNTPIPTNQPTVQPSLLATGTTTYLSFLIPILIVILSLML